MHHPYNDPNIGQYLGRYKGDALKDDDKLEKDIKRIARQTALTEIGKKPEVSVIISRLT